MMTTTNYRYPMSSSIFQIRSQFLLVTKNYLTADMIYFFILPLISLLNINNQTAFSTKSFISLATKISHWSIAISLVLSSVAERGYCLRGTESPRVKKGPLYMPWGIIRVTLFLVRWAKLFPVSEWIPGYCISHI